MGSMAANEGLVHKCVRVVRTIAGYSEGVGLSDLSRQTGISKATCYRITRALKEEGWLVAHPVTKRLRLSLDLVFMAGYLADEGSVARCARETLDELVKATGETAGLDRLFPDHVVVLAEAQGSHMIGQARRPVPREQSVWKAASGRLALALGASPEPTDMAWADQKARLEPRLEEIRANRYAVTSGQIEEGLTAVAVPVLVAGELEYALWVSGPKYRFDAEQVQRAREALTAAAERLGTVLEMLEVTSGDRL